MAKKIDFANLLNSSGPNEKTFFIDSSSDFIADSNLLVADAQAIKMVRKSYTKCIAIGTAILFPVAPYATEKAPPKIASKRAFETFKGKWANPNIPADAKTAIGVFDAASIAWYTKPRKNTSSDIAAVREIKKLTSIALNTEGERPIINSEYKVVPLLTCLVFVI